MKDTGISSILYQYYSPLLNVSKILKGYRAFSESSVIFLKALVVLAMSLSRTFSLVLNSAMAVKEEGG